jgi:hypothetical protein
MYGKWSLSPDEYADEAMKYRDKIGRMTWAAPQDWMCEPAIISGGQFKANKFKGTGLSVPVHQRRTVENYLVLSEIAPDVPWIPVIQGWDIKDYMGCVRLYEDFGVDLQSFGTVGVGSVCRRQNTKEIGEIFMELSCAGIRCHGFGVKKLGLSLYAEHLTSSDSLAWSISGRYSPPLRGCKAKHKNCANCLRFASKWRKEVLNVIYGKSQVELF